MDEEFEVTAAMLRKRPEMKQDGWKFGQKIAGKVLHARYSRYMQHVATVAPELVEARAAHGARFPHPSSIEPTGTVPLSLAHTASPGIQPPYAPHSNPNQLLEQKE